MIGVAEALAHVIDAPMRITAYDGSAGGDLDADVEMRILDQTAIAHMVRAPGELGMARAYISGALELRNGGSDVVDHYQVLRMLAREHIGALTMSQRLRVLRSLAPAVFTWVEPPPQEVGARHMLRKMRAHLPGQDAVAIAHHYDVSNRFYEWLLGPSMAYTCAVYEHETSTLEQAQAEKYDLVCRKLGLAPGMRLLDVGCGWGGMVLHAVREYGVTALGITLSREQATYAQQRCAERGIAGQAEVRHADYRSLTETGFDAISSIGLTEHIGISQLSSYAALLAGALRPGGRLLNHCITRPDDDSGAVARRGFIPRYVFPNGELPGVGRLMSVFQRAGFEVRHEENLREHYTRTCTAWSHNLREHWTDAVNEVGLATARVWALYLAGSQIGFEDNKIQLHQILAVKPDNGRSGMPLRPTW